MISFISNKLFENRPRKIKELTRNQLFFSERNINNLIASIYGIKLKYGYNTPINDLRPFTISMMRNWALDKNLDGVDILGSSINSYLQALKHINSEFLKDNYDAILQSSPFSRNGDGNIKGFKYQTGRIDPKFGVHNIAMKSQKDMMANDYNSIDVWAEVRTDLSRGIYRKKNAIPWDRIPAQRRYYDKTNDGLDRTIINSSLENKLYGYGRDYYNYTLTHTDDKNRNTEIRFD